MIEAKDYYAILGVSGDASEREIEQTYRALLREHYHDRSLHPDAQRQLNDVTEAYAVLTDPEMRAEYDERVGLNTGPPRHRHGFHLGLDVGIARVSVGIGHVDGLLLFGGTAESDGTVRLSRAPTRAA